MATTEANRVFREHPLFVCPLAAIWPLNGSENGFEDDACFLVLKLQGPDMRATIRQTGGLKLREVAGVLYDVLEAVQFLHERGYLHRDM